MYVGNAVRNAKRSFENNLISNLRPFCYKLSVHFGVHVLNHLDPFHVYLDPFYVYLDPFHVYKFTCLLIGLNNKQ